MNELEPREAARLYRSAAALLDQGFCQGALARSALRVSVPPSAPVAIQWCAVGALERICEQEFRPLEALVHALGFLTVRLACHLDPVRLENDDLGARAVITETNDRLLPTQGYWMADQMRKLAEALEAGS